MDFIKGDLVIEALLADGEEGKLTIRNVGLDMTDEYVADIVAKIKGIFEIDGQVIEHITGCYLSRVNHRDFPDVM